MTIDPVSIGITLALNAASAALTASRTIEGQRLSDLSVTLADYGTPFAYFMGVRRLEGAPVIWAEPIKEVKQRRKTKGGKYNDYTYFGTFAVAIAAHTIDAVSRIWFDKHLVYDATGAGAQSPFTGDSDFRLADSMRIYFGTEDQMPDPRMQATVEAEHGAGSCPAYRGIAYIVFEEIPLEKVGNRIPQVSVEAITSAKPHYPYESFPVTINNSRLWNTAISPDGSRLTWADGSGNYEIWDLISRQRMAAGNIGESLQLTSSVGIYNDGIVAMVANNKTDLLFLAPDMSRVTSRLINIFPATPGDQRWQENVFVRQDANGAEHWMTTPWSAVNWWFLDGVEQRNADMPGGGWRPTSFFTDLDGNIWAVGASGASGTTTAHFLRIVTITANGPDYVAATGLTPAGGTLGGFASAYHYRDDTHDQFVLAWRATYMHLVDRQTGVVTATLGGVGDPYNTPKQFANIKPGASSIWCGTKEVSSVDLSVIRTIDPNTWVVKDATGILYLPILNALACWNGPGAAMLTIRYLDRVASDGVTLGDVVQNVAGRAGIAAGDIDTSLLTAKVDGWSWTQGTGKDILEPLLDLYDADAREHGFTLQFLPRGGAAGTTISATNFVRGEQDGEATHTIDRGTATDTPRRLTLKFADLAADQQTNSASVARPLERVEGQRELTIDMTPWAAAVDTARQYAERMHRRRWFGRERYTAGLTAQMIGLEPGDVRLLSFDGTLKTARLTLASVDADEVIRTEWERDDPSVAVLSGQAGAPMDGRAPSELPVTIPTKGFVLDLPLLRDADNSVNPLLYFAASPYVAGTWPGATMLMSLDGGASYEDEWASVPSVAPATWGYAASALPAANPWLWDRGNSVTLKLQYGELVGVTEAECDANPQLNLALLGGELIQFTTATLNMDGTWTIGGFKRGRRGTEWACGTHVANEEFVLLDAAGHNAMGLSDVGSTERFKAVTVGREATSAFPIPVAFGGASLQPYAPARLRAIKDPATGDWAISWTRRTRVGGAWTGGSAIPLSEASEAYQVDVIDGGGALVRTISVTSPSASYSETDQVGDGGDVPAGSLHLALYQMSDAVGRGFAAMATF